MKHERVTGETQETAALYALGSLSQHEARGFENHLKEGCAVCEAELAQFENVVGTLGLTASEAEPPGYLRELLAAHVEQGNLAAPRAFIHEREKKELKPPIFSAARQFTARPKLNWLRVAPWVLAVACGLAAEEFYFAWRKAQQAVQARADEVAAARSDAEQLTRMLELERSRSKELELIGAALVKPGARVILLSGTDPSSPASVAILWDTSKRSWLVTGNLPAAPAGRGYQLWYVTPLGRYSAGMLNQDSAGHVFKVIEVSSAAINLTEVVITLERSAGSARPTWPVIARGGE